MPATKPSAASAVLSTSDRYLNEGSSHRVRQQRWARELIDSPRRTIAEISHNRQIEASTELLCLL